MNPTSDRTAEFQQIQDAIFAKNKKEASRNKLFGFFHRNELHIRESKSKKARK